LLRGKRGCGDHQRCAEDRCPGTSVIHWVDAHAGSSDRRIARGEK
jgi:hypothetical protein